MYRICIVLNRVINGLDLDEVHGSQGQCQLATTRNCSIPIRLYTANIILSKIVSYKCKVQGISFRYLRALLLIWVSIETLKLEIALAIDIWIYYPKLHIQTNKITTLKRRTKDRFLDNDSCIIPGVSMIISKACFWHDGKIVPFSRP